MRKRAIAFCIVFAISAAVLDLCSPPTVERADRSTQASPSAAGGPSRAEIGETGAGPGADSEPGSPAEASDDRAFPEVQAGKRRWTAPPTPYWPSDGSELSVQVIDRAAGRPLEGAVLTLHEAGLQEVCYEEISDADGFAYFPIKTGSFTMTADRSGYLRGMLQFSHGQSASNRLLTIELRRTGLVSGRLLDSDGHGIRGAELRLSPLREDSEARTVTFPSLDEGEFRVDVLPGEYRLRVRRLGYREAVVARLAVGDLGEGEELEIMLESLGRPH